MDLEPLRSYRLAVNGKEDTMTEAILCELLERLAEARELVDVNIAAGIASQQLDAQQPA